MSTNKPVRKTYIRRKRCLNQSIEQIKDTMIYIMKNTGYRMTESQLLEFAKARAKEIEAACWSPRLKISDKEYSQIVLKKTYQLCNILLVQSRIMVQKQFPLMQTRVAFPETTKIYSYPKSKYHKPKKDQLQPSTHAESGSVLCMHQLPPQGFSESSEIVIQPNSQITQNQFEDEQQDDVTFFFNQMRVPQDKNDFPQSIYWDK